MTNDMPDGLMRFLTDQYGFDGDDIAGLLADGLNRCRGCDAPISPWFEYCEPCAVGLDAVCDHDDTERWAWTDDTGTEHTICLVCYNIVNPAQPLPIPTGFTAAVERTGKATCFACGARHGALDDAVCAACRTQPLPIPTAPRHGRTNWFPRKPSSFATTDLTGADAATMAATVARDFGRFIR